MLGSLCLLWCLLCILNKHSGGWKKGLFSSIKCVILSWLLRDSSVSAFSFIPAYSESYIYMPLLKTFLSPARLFCIFQISDHLVKSEAFTINHWRSEHQAFSLSVYSGQLDRLLAGLLTRMICLPTDFHAIGAHSQHVTARHVTPSVNETQDTSSLVNRLYGKSVRQCLWFEREARMKQEKVLREFYSCFRTCSISISFLFDGEILLCMANFMNLWIRQHSIHSV